MRIRRHFTIIGHSPDEVELRHGVWNPISHTLVDEQRLGKLHSLIMDMDGSRTVRGLAEAHGLSRSHIEAVIDQLIAIDAVEEEAETALDQYLDRIVPALRGAAGAAPGIRDVLVLGDDLLATQVADLVAETLGEHVSVAGGDDSAWCAVRDRETNWLLEGLSFAEQLAWFSQWRGRLVVFPQQTIDPLGCQVINRVAFELGVPWMHAALDGPFVFVGPVFVPQRSACYGCFEKRVTMNLREATSYTRYKNALARAEASGGDGVAPGPMLGRLLATHTALEALNFAATGTTFTVGKAMSMYLPTMEIAFNEVLRLPGCDVCGAVSTRDQHELYFNVNALLNEV